MKLPNNTSHIKVPLSALRITGNVRKVFEPEDIRQLAMSIRRDGLMNPITVRPPQEDEDSNKTYEVIAGHRRVRAHQWLCDHGDDFSTIECCIRTGETWTLQMIENIQRTDLSPREKEAAIEEALDNGLSITDIADKLCKSIQYVSDIIAGIKVRKAADEAGVETDNISTKALSQLRSIPEEARAEAVRELAENGGTFREATRIMHEHKGDKEEAAPLPEDEEEQQDTNEEPDPFDIEPEPECEAAPSTNVSTAPAAQDDEGMLFISSVSTWQAKNKLQEEIHNVVLPFLHTELPALNIVALISFLKCKIVNLNYKFSNCTKINIDTEINTDGSSWINGKADGKVDDLVFSMRLQKIKGNALNIMRENWGK